MTHWQDPAIVLLSIALVERLFHYYRKDKNESSY